MATSTASGAQSATLDTGHTLSTVTTAGTYVLVVDTNAMVAGDILILRAKTKCKSGSTSRLAYSAVYANAQTDPNKYSIPIPIADEVVFTLEQTDGTGRSFDWNVLKL